MGAGQSSSSSQREVHVKEDIKTSYYEILGIERSATEDEIKKAYRRKALELHPDRNYGDVERTTKLFSEVQVAYDVLSDPQERAWYDSHEEAILNDIDIDSSSGTGDYAQQERSIGLTTAQDIMHLFRKFHGNIDFSDSTSGFYGFLRETFEQLAKEEENAARREDVDVPDYPSFGHQEDDYNDVVKPFYAIWNGFSTRKSFSWRDRYRTSDAPDRRVRRLIEKENKSFREEAIREYNDAVRSLVAFVRKRDPRYKPNTQSEAERQQALREAAAAQAARSRAANAAKMKQQVPIPEWAQSREEDELEGEITDDEESEEEHFECVACRKVFKSENQYEAHERSKKHIKTIQALKRRLRKENAAMGLGDEEEEEEEEGEEEPRESENTPPAEKESDSEHSTRNSLDEERLVDSDSGSDPDLAAKTDALDLDDSRATSEVGEVEKSNANTYHHQRRGASVADDDDDGSGNGKDSETENDVPGAQTPLLSDSESRSKQTHTPKMGKAAQKRAKKAAAAAAAAAQASSATHGEVENLHKCASCSAAFPSKNQLFQHLKKSNHAAPVASENSRMKGKANGKGSSSGRK